MTELELKEVIKTIVYSYDLSTMGIQGNLPETLRNTQLTDEDILNNMPSVVERAQTIAYNSCYALYCVQNENANLEDFKLVLTKQDFEKVTNHVLSKITPEIPVDVVREHHRVKFLNLTRVDVNRQARFDK
jgi:hypothetical protein